MKCVGCSKEFSLVPVGITCAGKSPKTKRFCTIECRAEAYKKCRAGSSDAPKAYIGAAHELLVCADLLKKGYPVFRAMSPQCPCDVAFLVGRRLYRVEVKTGYRLVPDGAVTSSVPVDLIQTSKFDVLAVVEHNGTITYSPGLPEKRSVRDTEPLDFRGL